MKQRGKTNWPAACIVVLALAACQLQLGCQQQVDQLLEEQQDDQAARSSLPLVRADTKYWLANTEFADHRNWLHLRKPCTILERVTIDEEAVVSLGSAWPLESNLRELILAPNGLLLLDANTSTPTSDPIDSVLSTLADCTDSVSSSTESATFSFSLDPDQISWWNPDNWHSPNYADWAHLLPDSHQVPCNEDLVVLGHKLSDLSRAFTFKVDLSPAKEAPRIGKLYIANQMYNKTQLDQLFHSAQYSNLLFVGAPIELDESSLIESQPDGPICQDEAGCQCGNESPEIMSIICSFHEPLKADQLVCWDPIQSTGYCNPICGFSLRLAILPDKFSERYLVQLMRDLELKGQEAKQEDKLPKVLVSIRRISLTAYELSLRPDYSDEAPLEAAVAFGKRYVELIRQELSRDAIRSFYGIRSIEMRASSRWRAHTRPVIFWGSLVMGLVLLILGQLFLLLRDHKIPNNCQRPHHNDHQQVHEKLVEPTEMTDSVGELPAEPSANPSPIQKQIPATPVKRAPAAAKTELELSQMVRDESVVAVAAAAIVDDDQLVDLEQQ